MHNRDITFENSNVSFWQFYMLHTLTYQHRYLHLHNYTHKDTCIDTKYELEVTWYICIHIDMTVHVKNTLK